MLRVQSRETNELTGEVNIPEELLKINPLRKGRKPSRRAFTANFSKSFSSHDTHQYSGFARLGTLGTICISIRVK